MGDLNLAQSFSEGIELWINNTDWLFIFKNIIYFVTFLFFVPLAMKIRDIVNKHIRFSDVIKDKMIIISTLLGVLFVFICIFINKK